MEKNQNPQFIIIFLAQDLRLNFWSKEMCAWPFILKEIELELFGFFMFGPLNCTPGSYSFFYFLIRWRYRDLNFIFKWMNAPQLGLYLFRH